MHNTCILQIMQPLHPLQLVGSKLSTALVCTACKMYTDNADVLHTQQKLVCVDAATRSFQLMCSQDHRFCVRMGPLFWKSFHVTQALAL